jgi:ferredoxin
VAVTQTHAVKLLQTGEVYACFSGETMLQGMARLGKRGIPAGCLNGGCGVCKISVRYGKVHKTGPMSRAHVSAEEEAQGIYLACRVAPLERVEVEVLGKMKKALQFGAWGST